MFAVLMQCAPEPTRPRQPPADPNDSRALFSLDRSAGRTMRSLADPWKCDPSNATWIIDRLEGLGLAERQSVPHDRRVKLVRLTAKGMKTRRELMKQFDQPPAEIASLDRDLEQLLRVLSKLTPAATSVLQHHAVRTGAHA